MKSRVIVALGSGDDKSGWHSQNKSLMRYDSMSGYTQHPIDSGRNGDAGMNFASALHHPPPQRLNFALLHVGV